MPCNYFGIASLNTIPHTLNGSKFLSNEFIHVFIINHPKWGILMKNIVVHACYLKVKLIMLMVSWTIFLWKFHPHSGMESEREKVESSRRKRKKAAELFLMEMKERRHLSFRFDNYQWLPLAEGQTQPLAETLLTSAIGNTAHRWKKHHWISLSLLLLLKKLHLKSFKKWSSALMWAFWEENQWEKSQSQLTMQVWRNSCLDAEYGGLL